MTDLHGLLAKMDLQLDQNRTFMEYNDIGYQLSRYHEKACAECELVLPDSSAFFPRYGEVCMYCLRKPFLADSQMDKSSRWNESDGIID